MLASFSKPRIEGTFKGDRLRAWDVVWGRGVADVVIENSYAIVSNARADARRLGDSRRRPVLARLSAQGPGRGDRRPRPARSSGRSAICATPSSSTTIRSRASSRASSTSTAATERPFGFGKMAIDEGVAYGETFERATSSLRFEGNGVRLDSLDDQEEQRDA